MYEFILSTYYVAYLKNISCLSLDDTHEEKLPLEEVAAPWRRCISWHTRLLSIIDFAVEEAKDAMSLPGEPGD